jgi:hypothetical protein
MEYLSPDGPARAEQAFEAFLRFRCGCSLTRKHALFFLAGKVFRLRHGGGHFRFGRVFGLEGCVFLRCRAFLFRVEIRLLRRIGRLRLRCHRGGYPGRHQPLEADNLALERLDSA